MNVITKIVELEEPLAQVLKIPIHILGKAEGVSYLFENGMEEMTWMLDFSRST